MTKIPLEKVKRDNTNLYAYDYQMSRELRKLRYKKVSETSAALYDDYRAVTRDGIVDPYPDLDFKLDMESFMETLSEAERNVFYLYFVEGMISTTIADLLGISQSWVTKLLAGNPQKGTPGLVERFKQYYLEDEDE